MTEFETFQILRDSYLERGGGIFGFARMVVKAKELGLSPQDTQHYLKMVQSHLNVEKPITLRDTGRALA